MFLAPKGPDQAVPEAEREWGLKSQGCCRRGASMTKALGMQVCRSVLTGLVTPVGQRPMRTRKGVPRAGERGRSGISG